MDTECCGANGVGSTIVLASELVSKQTSPKTRSWKKSLALLLVLALTACAPRSSTSEATRPANEAPSKATVTVRPTAALTAQSDETVALVNGTLVDGTGADPLPDAAVVIQKGRIVSVGSRDEVHVPAGAKVIDVQGATILPGFLNAHVHLGFDQSRLQAWAQAGVTTVRDLGVSPSPDIFLRRNSLRQDNRNARLVAVGPLVTVPGGYPMVPWGMQGLTVTSAEDAVSKVSQLLDDGADVVKIALESGSTFGRKIPVLSAAEAAAIVQVAHQRGTRVSAHVLASQDLPRVLEAGVDDIAHMVSNSLSDDMIARIVKAGIYWVPTIELWKNVGSGGQQAVSNLGRFVAAGGKVALGTDYAGYAAEFDLGMPVRELEWMLEAGMTAQQIILAGTQNAAYVCNLEHELGTLEAGKIADVLIVDGDPLQDIHALLNVRMVIHNGEIIRVTPAPPTARPTATANSLPPLSGSGGGRIAFSSNRDGNYGLHIMNSDGTDQWRLTKSLYEDRHPVWSPDGTRIAASRNEPATDL